MSARSIATIDWPAISALPQWQRLANDRIPGNRHGIQLVTRLLESIGFTQQTAKVDRTQWRCGDVKLEVFKQKGPHGLTKTSVIRCNLRVRTIGSGFATVVSRVILTVADLSQVLDRGFSERAPGSRGELPAPYLFTNAAYTYDPSTGITARCSVLSSCKVKWVAGIVVFDWSVTEDALLQPGAEPWFVILARTWSGRWVQFLTNCKAWYNVHSGVSVQDMSRAPLRISVVEGDLNYLYTSDRKLIRSAIGRWATHEFR